MSPPEDPFLYFAGAWAGLDDSSREWLNRALDDDTEARRLAWKSLLEEANPLKLALALDLVLQEQAASRMGDRTGFERQSVRAAALEILRAEGIDGKDRWEGQRVPSASHLVALRALGKVAEPEDAQLVSSVRSEEPRSTEWDRAWISAAGAVLARTSGNPASRLVEQLVSLARNENVAETARCGAVTAIAAWRDPSAERTLHELYRITSGDARIEAVAALAARDAQDEDELRFIQELLAGGLTSGVVLLRKPVLLKAVERQST